MNKTIFSVVAAAIMASGYAKADELAGQVTDNDGRPVEFVTVACLIGLGWLVAIASMCWRGLRVASWLSVRCV